MSNTKNIFSKVQNIVASQNFRIFIIAVFIIQSVFLVFATNIGTPPDENNHIDFARYYANHSITPTLTDQKPTHTLGDITREPDYLYGYIGSFVVRAALNNDMHVYILRMSSVLLALLTFLILIRVFEMLKIGNATINTSLAIITNLPMVLMLSSAVNNDVGVWFATLLSIWLILKYWEKPNITSTLILINIALYGSLYKRTFMPLGVFFVVVGFFLIASKWAIFKKSIKVSNWKIILATFFLIIGTLLFLERIGGNIVAYKTITPSCEQVKDRKSCSVHWLAKRQKWLDSGAPISGNTWLKKSTMKDSEAMNPLLFVGKWTDESLKNIVDIQTQSWRHEVKPPLWLHVVFGFVLAISIIYGIVFDYKHRKDKASKKRLFVIGVAAVVIVAQILFNYQLYLKDLVFGIALNGRYILPAIIILSGLCGYYLTKIIGNKASVVLGLVLVVLVIVDTGLLMMVRNPQLFTG